jgi:MFS family permease
MFVGVLFVMAWGTLSLPATFALIGDNLPESKRAMGFSVQSILKRAPIVVGPIIGGVLLDRYTVLGGMRIGLLITIPLALGTAWLQHRLYREKPRNEPPPQMSFAQSFRALSPSLKRLLVAEILTRFGQGVATEFIILYATEIVGVSDGQYGSLVSLQMAVSILTYIPIAYLADRYGRRPFVLAAFALFAAYPLAIGLAPSYLFLLFAFAVAGSRELGEPARKALLVDLAHPSRRGRDVGVYYLVRGLCVIAAPTLGAFLYERNPTLCFGVATGVATLGLLWFAFVFKMPEGKAEDGPSE